MITFIICILALVAGYCFYGKFIERQVGVDSSRVTPAVRLEDGIDYKVMSPWRMYVIQFLNIAGLGPIFGAIMGAAYGPMAYLWIVLGCIFMGAVHDFVSGMLSIYNDGMGLPQIVGKYSGRAVRAFMVVFTAFLLMAVGSSFVTGPAGLLANLFNVGQVWWVYVILAYYIAATLLPIDKIIGKVYPLFGALLLLMAVMVGFSMIIKGFSGELVLPELTAASFANFHSNPDQNLLVPMLFVVISCGAISGFHATQSPLMARCMSNEKYGRPVFYGAMISEGIVALIWATAAIAYCGGADGLNAAADSGQTPAILVNAICNSWLGRVGAIIAVLGVVVCPITSGDTAFRSLRLIIADALHFDQKPILNRIVVTLPILLIAFLICKLDFSIIWKYVGICNQALATITLWTCARYFSITGKNHLLLSVPATFLTFVCVAYIMVAPHKVAGLALDPVLGNTVGIITAAVFFILFILKNKNKNLRYE